MSIHLDEDVLTEILKRIPAKPLVKLRCVSKSWNSLITNPSFISIHTNHTINSPSSSKSLLRHYSWLQRQESYTLYSNSFDPFAQIEFPFKSYSQYFEIVGSCNGVLCLSDPYRVNSHTIMLWNPTIRKSLTLPPPCIDFDQVYMFVLGFGLDSKTSRHKVVRVVYSRVGSAVIPEVGVEVFELGTKSWRKIRGNCVIGCVISEISLQVFVNGGVHWIGYDPMSGSDDFRGLSIVRFDMACEMFDEMPVPDSVSQLSVLDLSVFVTEDKLLSLIQYNRHTGSPWVRYGSCSVWVMKEYGNVGSWSKRFRVDLEGGIGKVLGVRGCGERVLIVSSKGELVLCDSENGESTRIGIEGVMKSFHMEGYVESLIMLDCFDRSY